MSLMKLPVSADPPPAAICLCTPLNIPHFGTEPVRDYSIPGKIPNWPFLWASLMQQWRPCPLQTSQGIHPPKNFPEQNCPKDSLENKSLPLHTLEITHLLLLQIQDEVPSVSLSIKKPIPLSLTSNAILNQSTIKWDRCLATIWLEMDFHTLSGTVTFFY